eukprot:Rmarinus@m.9763
MQMIRMECIQARFDLTLPTRKCTSQKNEAHNRKFGVIDALLSMKEKRHTWSTLVQCWCLFLLLWGAETNIIDDTTSEVCTCTVGEKSNIDVVGVHFEVKVDCIDLNDASDLEETLSTFLLETTASTMSLVTSENCSNTNNIFFYLFVCLCNDPDDETAPLREKDGGVYVDHALYLEKWLRANGLPTAVVKLPEDVIPAASVAAPRFLLGENTTDVYTTADASESVLPSISIPETPSSG